MMRLKQISNETTKNKQRANKKKIKINLLFMMMMAMKITYKFTPKIRKDRGSPVYSSTISLVKFPSFPTFFSSLPLLTSSFHLYQLLLVHHIIFFHVAQSCPSIFYKGYKIQLFVLRTSSFLTNHVVFSLSLSLSLCLHACLFVIVSQSDGRTLS